MSDSPPAGPDTGPPTPSERRTVSRPAGLAIALVTAALVSVGGTALLPAPSTGTVAVVAAPQPPEAAAVAAPTAGTAVLDAGGPLGADADGASSGRTATAAGPSIDAGKGVPSEPPTSAAPVVATEEASEERAPRSRRSERSASKRRHDRTVSATRTGADGGASADATAAPPSDAAAAVPGESSPPAAAAEPAKNPSASPVDCALAEKDMAREAWRRNRPAVCPLASSGKAFVLIPLKGSLEGESHALHRRPVREARIVLPAGSASLLTMKQYKVRRLGFKDLRVNTTEDGGMRLRVTLLPGAGDPVFEIKDGYAKITVATPAKS